MSDLPRDPVRDEHQVALLEARVMQMELMMNTTNQAEQSGGSAAIMAELRGADQQGV